MDPELRAAFEPVHRDLRSGCAVTPRLSDYDSVGNDLVGVWLHAPDGSGQVVSVVRGLAPVDQIVQLADQVQEWAVEALWRAGGSAVWPRCPAHPHTHPLTAEVVADSAMWVCPRTGKAVARVGEYADAEV